MTKAPVIDALINWFVSDASNWYKYRWQIQRDFIFQSINSNNLPPKTKSNKFGCNSSLIKKDLNQISSFCWKPNNPNCKMLSCRIISFVILLVVFQIDGSPLPEKTSETSDKAQRVLTSKLLRRIKNGYLCSYFANPPYDQYVFFSPLTSTDYLFSLRSIRARCDEMPLQKYSVWDLVWQSQDQLSTSIWI